MGPERQKPERACAFTCLIPYRKREGQFDRLRRLLDALKVMPFVDRLIVSEYGVHDPALDPLPVLVVQEHCEGIWNRSRCLNNGLRHCHSPYVLILDADCVPHPGLTPALVDLHGQWPAVILRHTRFGCRLSGAGNLSVEAGFLRSVGGYDEVFEGYGREDKDLELRLQPHGAYLEGMIVDDHNNWPLAPEIAAAWERNKIYFAEKHRSRSTAVQPGPQSGVE